MRHLIGPRARPRGALREGTLASPTATGSKLLDNQRSLIEAEPMSYSPPGTLPGSDFAFASDSLRLDPAGLA